MMLLKLLGVSVIACLLAFGAGYFKGKSVAERACETASLRAEIAELKLAIETQKQADAEETTATIELAKEKAELEQKVSAYEDKLPKQPENGCAVTDDDLRVMQ
jgi:hypothetical protein